MDFLVVKSGDLQMLRDADLGGVFILDVRDFLLVGGVLQLSVLDSSLSDSEAAAGDGE